MESDRFVYVPSTQRDKDCVSATDYELPACPYLSQKCTATRVGEIPPVHGMDCIGYD